MNFSEKMLLAPISIFFYEELKELSTTAIMTILSTILYHMANDRNLDFESVMEQFNKASIKTAKELS